MEISLATGLRIGDVLALRSDAVRGAKDGRLTVRESKTGKTRRIRLPGELHRRAISMAGKAYVFEGRTDWRKPRTRQAVYKDLKRIAKAYRLKANIAPHSARKVYAVEAYKRTGDLKRVQALLNHSSEAVTALYALADELTARRMPGRS
jgi:integrase